MQQGTTAGAMAPEEDLTELERESFEHAATWGASRAEAIERSERRAWFVATFACIAALSATGAVAALALTHEVETRLIRLDSETGVFEVVQLLDESELTAEEAMIKSFIRRFVRARESYVWETLQADYDTTLLLAGPEVAADYMALFAGEDALDERWGSSVRATVSIKSAPLGAAQTATVRFSKTTAKRGRPQSAETSHWIATLAYEFDPNLKMSEEEAEINWPGFQVVSYRVDPEAPPAQARAATEGGA